VKNANKILCSTAVDFFTSFLFLIPVKNTIFFSKHKVTLYSVRITPDATTHTLTLFNLSLIRSL
jgi:hypothetical protein